MMNLPKPWIAVVLLLLSLQTIAQEKYKRLYIGDRVPDLEFKGMYNYPTKTARLSDFKGKAVILDFWNQYCHSCIAGFPKMQKLQAEFKDELVILLINENPDETRKALDARFKTSPILKATTLPMVLGDSFYDHKGGLFPHMGGSYHVWIDKNGIIQATTYGYEATSENVSKFLKGEPLNIAKRVDIMEKIPLGANWLTINDGRYISNLLYYKSNGFTYEQSGKNSDLDRSSIGKQDHFLFMKPPYGGAMESYLGSIKDKSGKVIGKSSSRNLRMHYLIAYDLLMANIPVILDDDGSLNLNEQILFQYLSSSFEGRSDFWRENVLRPNLENHFGYKGVVEVRNIECYVLNRTEQILQLPLTKDGAEIWEDTKSKGGFVIQNCDFSFLRAHLADSFKDKFGNDASVFDETGISPQTKVDLTITGNLEDIPKLNAELSKYGLGIRMEKRWLPILVLRKVK